MLVNIVVLVLVKGRIQCIGIIFDYELGNFCKHAKLCMHLLQVTVLSPISFFIAYDRLHLFSFSKWKNLTAYNKDLDCKLEIRYFMLT